MIAECIDNFGRYERKFMEPRVSKNTGNRLVIELRDRIELVIMAPGAGRRQSQKPSSQRIDAICQSF